MMREGWREIAAGVLIRRYAELDLTVGLVLGDDQALVIDTRGDGTQGSELAEAVRRITPLPLHIAITHGHFDHCFGTTAFLPAPVWAHSDCRPFLERTTTRQRDHYTEYYRNDGKWAIAEALATSEPALPDHPVRTEQDLDLGGRTVRLQHLGTGHTDHDLVAVVPDADIVFAGDLVESGGPPDYEDAFPESWPAAVDRVLDLRPTSVVAGHGEPVSTDFVRAQREEIATVAELCRAFSEGTTTAREAVERSPFPATTTFAALDRAGK